MRKPIPKDRRNKAFGISFPPELKDRARKRAFSLEMSLSAYLQQLVERDLKAQQRKKSKEHSNEKDTTHAR